MLAAPAAANNGLPCFQQGDCPSADAGSTVSATAAAQSNQMPVVSSDQMLAVQSGQLAEAAANANNPVLKQGDCPPADAGSSVNAAQANAAGSAAQTNANPSAANSTAADATTARLKESPAAGSQQGDYSATDALCLPVAAQIAQDITAAAQSDPADDSLTTTQAQGEPKLLRLKAAISLAAAQIRFATTNFGSIIGFLSFRFKYSAQLSDLSGLKFDMASTFDYLLLKE